MKYISFNPIYVLKPDIGRALLLPAYLDRENGVVKSHSEFIVHPIHAVILNFLNGDDYESTVDRIASFLKVERLVVEHFISTLIDNKNYVKFHNKKLPSSYYFPPMTIITSNHKRKTVFPSEAFLGKGIDIRRKRHNTPTNLILMLNNQCVTDCFYCYADKTHSVGCSIPFERLEQLIEEAREIGVNNFDVIGGEFFLYKHWKNLLITLHKHGYHPYISTKMPLDEEIVMSLSDLNIKDIQISLDTLIEDHLCSILNVRLGYLDKVKQMFQLLNKYHINVFVHTILTSRNDSVEDVKSVFEFISLFDNILDWKLDIAYPSLYKKESYNSIKPSPDKVGCINNYLSSVEKLCNFKIRSKSNTVELGSLDYPEDAKLFTNRAICSGNYSSFFILPDGNVTICEELYWHEKFIIGNVVNQNLLEVWNSKEALDLFYLSQSMMPKDSKCSSCSIFNECRQGKGVCWKSVLKEYGADKWYYPDPLCPM